MSEKEKKEKNEPSLKKELDDCIKERDEYLAGWQRERADMANLRKSHSEQIQRLKEGTVVDVLESFVPVLDSFNMAMANTEVWESVDGNWRTGVEYIYQQIRKVFEDYGVKEVGNVGDVYDPKWCEVVESIDVNEEEMDSKIVEVRAKGYVLGDIVIRPAKVLVGNYAN